MKIRISACGESRMKRLKQPGRAQGCWRSRSKSNQRLGVVIMQRRSIACIVTMTCALLLPPEGASGTQAQGGYDFKDIFPDALAFVWDQDIHTNRGVVTKLVFRKSPDRLFVHLENKTDTAIKPSYIVSVFNQDGVLLDRNIVSWMFDKLNPGDQHIVNKSVYLSVNFGDPNPLLFSKWVRPEMWDETPAYVVVAEYDDYDETEAARVRQVKNRASAPERRPVRRAEKRQRRLRALPDYEIIEETKMLDGGLAGFVLIPKLRPSHSADELERIAWAIAKKHGYALLAMYRTKEAMKANDSASYAKAHPRAYKAGYLGSIFDGKFHAP